MISQSFIIMIIKKSAKNDNLTSIDSESLILKPNKWNQSTFYLNLAHTRPPCHVCPIFLKAANIWCLHNRSVPESNVMTTMQGAGSHRSHHKNVISNLQCYLSRQESHGMEWARRFNIIIKNKLSPLPVCIRLFVGQRSGEIPIILVL